MFRAATDFIVSLVYPRKCRTCNQAVESMADGFACADCWSKTRIFSGRHIICDKCGNFLGESDGFVSRAVSCHLCNEQDFDAAKAVGIYEFGLAASVIGLKTTPHISSTPLSFLLHRFHSNEFRNTDLLVPVPLSKKRELERGFNQSEILACALSRKTGIKVDSGSLVRSIDTPMHRAGMDRKARELTVKKAFAVLRPNLIKNKNILLIDDVVTSGSTASACSRILKKSGANTVNVLTLARAVQTNY